MKRILMDTMRQFPQKSLNTTVPSECIINNGGNVFTVTVPRFVSIFFRVNSNTMGNKC